LTEQKQKVHTLAISTAFIPCALQFKNIKTLKQCF